MTAEARDLTARLRWLQEQRHEKTEAKDYRGATQALDLAVSLVDAATHRQLGEALLHATNPANTPPVPVVLGPQDVAAVVDVEEVMALVRSYAQATMAWSSAHHSGEDVAELGRTCQRVYRELHMVVERLATATVGVNVDRAREGRPS